MLRMVISGALISAVLMFNVAPPSRSTPPGTPGNGSGTGGVTGEGDTVSIDLTGAPNTRTSKGSNGTLTGPTPSGSDASNDNISTSTDPCWYSPTPPIKDDPRLGGDDPSTGILYRVSCPDAISLATGELVYADEGFLWTRTGEPVVPPPPDPAKMAQEAAGQMRIVSPTPHLGPNINQLAVKVPIWLWIDEPRPMSLTVSIRGLSVKAVASLDTTTWSMGEPDDIVEPQVRVPQITCQGSGVPSPARPAQGAHPTCGYTYKWRSLAGRTNGTKTWTVTTTTQWKVTWTASNGAHGELADQLVSAPRQQQVTVGEWRSSLIATTGG